MHPNEAKKKCEKLKSKLLSHSRFKKSLGFNIHDLIEGLERLNHDFLVQRKYHWMVRRRSLSLKYRR